MSGGIRVQSVFHSFDGESHDKSEGDQPTVGLGRGRISLFPLSIAIDFLFDITELSS